MSGVTKIEIAESVEELKLLMKQQKTALGFAKVQTLYLLKINALENINHLAIIIGRGESTIHRWLQLYRQGGLELLLEVPPKTGRPKKLDVETVAKIQRELSDPEGFYSYQEVQIWLRSCLDKNIDYTTIYRVVRYELRGKLKIPRPFHEKQEPGVIEVFKNYLPTLIKGIIHEFKDKIGHKSKISYWCQDEARLGFRTLSGKKITLKGVKPKQLLQWHYTYYYVYGLVEPISGRSFFYEFSHLNGECFEQYLNQFSEHYPNETHIIQLDNASFHTTKKLTIPKNIILLFQPPYCPELNPIERVWEYVKYYLQSRLFTNLEDLRNQTANLLNSLSNKLIQSLTGYQYIIDGLSI
ncbi:MAG: IS630 family transposase [Prochloraceae cyanobacterium]